MKWNNVFKQIQSISTAAAKAFIESTATDAYQLIDVRQPEEFMKQHLPGALPVPLNDLVADKAVLNPEKPTLVYCSRGERSLAASQWLINQGFSDVRHIEGGIDDWMGNKAFGHFDLNLSLLTDDAEFPDAISMAYAMEEGLRLFYMELARETSQPVFQKLYRKLARFEVEHKTFIANKYLDVEGKELIQKEVEERHGQIMEGGGYADITLIKTLADTSDMMDVFGLAMAFEVQAFDFYFRLSQHTLRADVKSFFLEMADAEKEHLAFIATEMDRYLADNREARV